MKTGRGLRTLRYGYIMSFETTRLRPVALIRLYYALHYTTIRLQLQVDFDKTKHLAESTIKKRTEERESLAADEREREETERRQKHLDELKRSEELKVSQHNIKSTLGAGLIRKPRTYLIQGVYIGTLISGARWKRRIVRET